MSWVSTATLLTHGNAAACCAKALYDHVEHVEYSLYFGGLSRPQPPVRPAAAVGPHTGTMQATLSCSAVRPAGLARVARPSQAFVAAQPRGAARQQKQLQRVAVAGTLVPMSVCSRTMQVQSQRTTRGAGSALVYNQGCGQSPQIARSQPVGLAVPCATCRPRPTPPAAACLGRQHLHGFLRNSSV